jgi:hypothetical protein
MADNLPQTGSKRGKPSDSDELPLHQKQTERQTRQRQNTSGSISDDIIDSINEPESDSTWHKNHEVFNNTTHLDKFTVGDLTRVVADILGDPHFVSQMSKMMSKQVAVNLGKSIEATCLKCIEPLTHKIEKQSKLIDNLLSRVSVLEKDLEEQQQYSRRTSLRFNNVNLPY